MAKETQDQGPSLEERKAALEARLAKLRSELREIQDLEKDGGVVKLIKNKLSDRKLKSRSVVDKNEPRHPVKPPTPQPGQTAPGEAVERGVDAGGQDVVSQDAGGRAPKRNKATLISGDIAQDLPKGTIMTVDDLAVSQGDFDALVKYYKSYPQSLSEDQIRSKAIEALVMVKTAQARFPAGSRKAQARILEIQKELAKGTDFAEVAKSKSDCPSKTNGGSLGLFSRHQMDPNFTMESFTTKVGTTTKIFPSAFGFHIVKINKYERGDTPLEDKVNASHILTLYDTDPNKVSQCRADAMEGRSKIQFVKQDMLKYAPQAYK